MPQHIFFILDISEMYATHFCFNGSQIMQHRSGTKYKGWPQTIRNRKNLLLPYRTPQGMLDSDCLAKCQPRIWMDGYLK